jgi:two-component system, chemotaxis family, protein-glutamate methylesterase/glutaminase
MATQEPFAAAGAGDQPATRDVDAGSVETHERRADRLVVVGASAGGVEALIRLVGSVPARLPAAVVVVLHTPVTATSRLPEILGRSGPMPAAHASGRQPLVAGRVLVAPPDRHVVVRDGDLVAVEGPRENGVRPAIDPLFRSAARAYGPRTVGVILSGTLDDGTAGVAAIRAAGGTTIAQDPSDAVCAGMPQNAIESGAIDRILRADEIGPVLGQLMTGAQGPVRRRATDAVAGADATATPSTPTEFVCPECGGVLRAFGEFGIARFHCRVGHDFSPSSLVEAYDARLEAALWEAIRTLEESAALSRRLAKDARSRGAPASAARFDVRERDSAERADVVRSAVLRLSDLEETPSVGEPEPVASEDDARRPRAIPDRETA